jgi:4-hydroxybenzoate polyprenyltransferase
MIKKYLKAFVNVIFANVYNKEEVIVFTFLISLVFFVCSFLIDQYNTKIFFIVFGVLLFLFTIFKFLKNNK